MAFKLASLFVDITANTGAMDKALGRVRSTLTSTLSGMSGIAAKGAGLAFAPFVGAAQLVSSAWSGAFVAVGVAAATATALAVNEASDLNETISKVRVVFGEAAKGVESEADAMAKAFGIPRREFLDAASAIGLMGKAAKLSQSDAAQMGIALAKLGVDAASFYNVGLDVALEKIRAGLSGEAEPLRAFGVLLNEEAVKAEAARMGIAKLSDELTEGQKVRARASLITKGLADANGDLARTADGVANRLRELGGRFQNLAADMGQYLLPAIKRLTGGLSEGLEAVGRFAEDNKEAFEAWSSSLEGTIGLAVAAVKHWPEGLELAKQFALEKLTNIKEAFDWLLANIPPVMDRIALAIEEGFKRGMNLALAQMDQGLGNAVGKWSKFVGFFKVGPDGQILTGEAVKGSAAAAANAKTAIKGPRDFVPFAPSASPNRVAAQAAVAARAAEDEAARNAPAAARAWSDSFAAELRAQGEAEGRATAAKEADRAAHRKRVEGDPFSISRARGDGEARINQHRINRLKALMDPTPDRITDADGRELNYNKRHDAMLAADRARARAMNQALRNPPQELTDAQLKRVNARVGVTDADSYARELQEAALHAGDTQKEMVDQQKEANRTLEVIAKNTAMKPGGNPTPAVFR